MTVPLTGVPLAAHADVYAALARAGFTDLRSSEVNGCDAFTPLTLAAAWQPDLRLGTAIVPAYTRGPGLLAMSAGRSDMTLGLRVRMPGPRVRRTVTVAPTYADEGSR
jgi:alkanesulfonate monooxygenase SsuD/methylene tetrahydromethanopterin reductase-like flavin-dependent oxidoreductase (luciferase family)